MAGKPTRAVSAQPVRKTSAATGNGERHTIKVSVSMPVSLSVWCDDRAREIGTDKATLIRMLIMQTKRESEAAANGGTHGDTPDK